ncbi:hypothetical protein BDW75DRAFT_214776 [Aspergillus navahoensis]
MPPTFRSSRSGRQFGDGVNRTRTGQVDHDVFEGLPVRRWTRQIQTVSQEPKTDGTDTEASGNGGKPSIPEHPMPRDSHLLSPMSRALLRAARVGCIYIRQASKDFDDEEKETMDPEEQQSQQSMERNFSLRKWTTVPKHLEAPEVEFLAKRRPGLPSLYGATAGTVDGAGSMPMRKTRFKKVDPVTGNILLYAAWVPEGHKIEGEITDDAQVTADSNQSTVTPQAPAPGTVIEGVGVVDAQGVVVAAAGSAAVITPQKRRPPPPKRKGKGLKGRRKKVMFAPGEGADAALVHAAGAGDSAANYGRETDSSRMSVDQTTQDDEDDDGEEGEESDYGEGDESSFDTKTPETPGPQPSTEPEPTPGTATEPTPTPPPAKSQTNADLHASQVSQAPEPRPEAAAEPLQPSTQLVAPLPPPSGYSPATPTCLANSARHQSPQATGTAPVSEDIQMTDATTTENTLHPSPTPTSVTQPQPTPAVAQPPNLEKALSPPQQSLQPQAPEVSSVAVKSAQPPATEQPHVTMEEASISAPEPPKTEPESMDFSTEAPQSSLPDQAPGNGSASPQADQHLSGSEFNLLDNLEASLDSLPKEAPSDAQKGTIPEQKPGVAPSQETITVPEPAAPARPTETPVELKTAGSTTGTKGPFREDPVAPPVEQLTPPGAEQTISLGTSEQTPQQTSPALEQHQPGNLPEALTHPEPDPGTSGPLAAPEEPEEKPHVPVPVPLEPVEPAEAIAKPQPPTAEEPSPQRSSEVEQGQEQRTITTPGPIEPAGEPVAEKSQPQPTAQDPYGELQRPQTEQFSLSNAESPEGPQGEGDLTRVAQGQRTSGDGPSPNSEEQPQ